MSAPKAVPTPGPWETEKCRHGWTIAAPKANGLSVVGPQDEEGRYGSIDFEADARLIAAAPDLLEALMEAEYWVREYMEQNDCPEEDEDLDVSKSMAKIRAALAKAVQP